MLFYWIYSLPDYTWIHCSKFIILNLIPSGRFIPMGGYTAGEAALVISVTLGPVCWPSHLLGQLKDGLILCLLALPSALLLPPITALLVAFSFWSVLYQHWHQRGESCFSASDRRTSSSSPFCRVIFVFNQASLSSERICIGILQGSLWSAGYLHHLLTFPANLHFQ